ncbi:hypothetical protein F4813DRAFT_366638 [Daldinia decipiens]|uniref:uncharacterized protein n=1 Tax=Daldinia decipiens TaxID=326647 RepID=UPI0020C2A027|nr:uncharacterized protein F4813DRAFT_366638 [Daldinia decipiens]KAI1655608.1 hypothetical protein F4813DRAFT_366638 [Daldinia decipiens]
MFQGTPVRWLLTVYNAPLLCAVLCDSSQTLLKGLCAAVVQSVLRTRTSRRHILRLELYEKEPLALLRITSSAPLLYNLFRRISYKV